MILERVKYWALLVIDCDKAEIEYAHPIIEHNIK